MFIRVEAVSHAQAETNADDPVLWIAEISQGYPAFVKPSRDGYVIKECTGAENQPPLCGLSYYADLLPDAEQRTGCNHPEAQNQEWPSCGPPASQHNEVDYSDRNFKPS